MACKLCNKSLHYETSWVVPDGGYGDNDYGGVNIHQIIVRVCPHCGEIKVNNKLSEKEQQEYVIQMLANIISNNMKYLKDVSNAEDKIVEQVKTLIKHGNKEYYEKIISENGFEYKNGKLFCSCGEEITTGIDAKEVLFKLKEGKANYCQNCGKHLKNIKTLFLDKEEPLDFMIESKETWNRGR